MMLSESEIKSIRYYIGDVEGTDKFWGDPKAYLVLNSLFYPDIATETARANEGKFLNSEILADTERLADIYRNLFSAFSKCRSEKEISAYRVERFADYVISKKSGGTVSFTSTSTNGFLSSYRDRCGIALMSFRIKIGTPCLNMAEIMRNYVKPDEAEVLLPPFLKLEFNEIPLNEKEMQITDSEGNPPVLLSKIGTLEMNEITSYANIPIEGGKAGMRVLDSLNNGQTPISEDIELYCVWKKAFISRVFLESF